MLGELSLSQSMLRQGTHTAGQSNLFGLPGSPLD